MKLTPAERVIAWRLAEGRRIPVDELIGALWGRCEDGGPLYAGKIVQLHMHRLRTVLLSFGIEIGVRYTYGYQVPDHQIAALRSVIADEIARNVHSGRLRNRKSVSASGMLGVRMIIPTRVAPAAMEMDHANASFSPAPD